MERTPTAKRKDVHIIGTLVQNPVWELVLCLPTRFWSWPKADQDRVQLCLAHKVSLNTDPHNTKSASSPQ